MTSHTTKDNLDYAIRVREAHSPYRHSLRWFIMQRLNVYSPDFRRSIESLRSEHGLLLTLTYSQITGLQGDLAAAEQFPKRSRPRGEWRKARPYDYQHELWDLGRRIGLMDPLGSGGWTSTSGRERPVKMEWGELLHCYLRNSAVPEDFYTEIRASNPTFAPIPWLPDQPRRQGRHDPDRPSWSDIETAFHVAQRLAGWRWWDVAESCKLHQTQAGHPLAETELNLLCRRLAIKLGIAALS